MPNDDDILHLDTPKESPGQDPEDTGGQPGNARDAQNARTVQGGVKKSAAKKPITKKVHWIVLGVLVLAGIALFLVKFMIDSMVSTVMHHGPAVTKQKPLSYAAHAKANADSGIQSILQQQLTVAPAASAHPPISGLAPSHPVQPSINAGIPGVHDRAFDANPQGKYDAIQVKKAQIAASKLVAIQGEKTGTATPAPVSTNPDSPSAIEARIAALKAEDRAAYNQSSDNNMGLNSLESLQNAALASGKHAPSAGHSSQQSQWFSKNSGSAGYGAITSTLPRLHHVALYPGSMISAVTVTRVSSQTPGQIIAQVTRTVYNDAGVVAIPSGSRLIGRYDGDISGGQSRVLMSFTRVIFPSGEEVALQGMNSTGLRGANGVTGNVHTHFWTNLGASLLVAMITDGVDSIPNPNSQTSGNTYIGGGSNPAQAGAQVMQNQANNLLAPYENLQPTITVPAGTSIRIMVNKTVLLLEKGQ